jgi:hypothetical protein
MRQPGTLPPEVRPAAPVDPRALDMAGVAHMLGALVVQGRRDAKRGWADAESFVATVESARPRFVRMADRRGWPKGRPRSKPDHTLGAAGD